MLNKEIVVDNTLEARRLLPLNSLQWVRSAFLQFKAFPFVWITLALMYLVVILIATQHAFLQFLSTLILPIFNGGLFIAAATGNRGISPRIEQFFIAFKTHALKLMVVGALWGLIAVLFQEVLFSFILHMPSHLDKLSPEQFITHLQQLPSTSYLILLGLFGLFLFFSIAYAIIPGLIIFNRLPLFAAYRLAFSACLFNWQSILLYLFIFFGLSIIASIPFFIGWIVLFPMTFIINFYIWQDLFTLPKWENIAE